MLEPARRGLERAAYNLGPPQPVRVAWVSTVRAEVPITSPTFAVPLVMVAGVLGLGFLGPLYGPFQLVRWASAYRQVPELAQVVSDSVLVVAVSTIAAATSALVLLGTRPRRRVSSSHGSAR